MTTESEPEFPPGSFERVDDGDDAAFYAPPRLVTHIDDAAIAALRDHYGRVLKPNGVVLDLMSSWVSHLPEEPELLSESAARAAGAPTLTMLPVLSTTNQLSLIVMETRTSVDSRVA